MKRSVWIVAVFLLMAGVLTTGEQADRPTTIPGHYIVVFDDSVVDAPGLTYELARAHGIAPRFVYEYALKGFAAQLPEQAVEALSRNPRVAYIEPDSAVWAFETQTNPTWGLDRIDQRALALDGKYVYDNTGAGVTAYVIDTGIRISHDEFGGRAVSGYDAVTAGGSADDCNGHGTHVAGTIGGATYGVAKGVILVAVRVLDCGGSGTTSGVIAGIDWVTANAIRPAVANMSLGGGASTALDNAVRNSVASGVAYAVAAGNGNFIGLAQDACNYSPARVAEAMTVSATDSSDKKASWANYGNCVDWFAPGVNITSAWYTGNSAINTISGTSMATPHTAGVAALYLQANPGATPQQVRDAIYAATTKGVVSASNTANNHLLFNMNSGSSQTNNPPTANFTFTTSDLTAYFTDTSADSDGTVGSWSWSFGDGAASAAQHPSHTYAAGNTYTVTLTVTDDGGATGTATRSVTVTSSSGGGITLSVRAYKVKGVQYADLTWDGAATSNVDVFRNGAYIVTTPNDGSHKDNIGKKGGGTYTYKVCETGSGGRCSNEVKIVF